MIQKSLHSTITLRWIRKDCYLCLCCAVLGRSVVSDCNPMDCSPPGSSVHGASPVKDTGVGCHALLQRIFPTQGSNSGILHCRWILYQPSYQGSPHLCLPYIKYNKRKSDEVYQYMLTVFNCWQWLCQCSGDYEGFSHHTLCLSVLLRYLEEWMRKKIFFYIRTVRLGWIGTLMKSLNQVYEISPININIIFL